MKCTVFLLIVTLWATARPMGADTPVGPEIPNYSSSERSEVPEACRWRLEDIFPDVEAWRGAMAETRRILDDFTARMQAWDGSTRGLAACLAGREELQRRLVKLVGYPSFLRQIRWSDPGYHNMVGEAEQLQAAGNTRCAELEQRILQLDESILKTALEADTGLKPHAVYVRAVLRRRAHQATPAAAEIVGRLGFLADGPSIAANCLRNLDMPAATAILPDGARLTMDGANWWKLALSTDARERRAADEADCRNRRQYENTFAALLDMSVKRDWFNARVGGYPDCLTAELYPYEVPPAVYRNLVQTIRTHLEPYHRYLRLRKRMLGLTELHPYDAYLPTSAMRPPRFTFTEARALVEESTGALGREYGALVRRAFDDRWFDVYGHKDKMNMGSALSLKGVHPFINLDYRGGYFDLITVTHELGHALSMYIPEQSQPFSASDQVWFVSEVPSTFNEILLMDHLVRRTTDEERRLALLAQYLERLNLLLFSCAQKAELELAIHEHVEAGGALTPAWLNARQLELARHYQGHDRGVMVVDEYVQSEWNHANTFFAPFQSYFYTVGAVVSLALHESIADRGATVGKYLDFLRTGGSRPILEVLGEMGIDLRTPQPILKALAALDRLVAEMEVLQERREKRRHTR